jgi:hypothetical protein
MDEGVCKIKSEETKNPVILGGQNWSRSHELNEFTNAVNGWPECPAVGSALFGTGWGAIFWIRYLGYSQRADSHAAVSL